MRVVVVGAGMAGVLAAIKLRDAGFTDVTVYEKADRLGGTWRENTYPGIACDVPAHLYSYTFAPNPEWSHMFAPGAEILAYFENVARRYGVAGLIRYGHEVRRLQYDGNRWCIQTSTSERDEADVVIAATGVLHHPRYPDIDGLKEFAGRVFHSARWDHGAALAGARLGVVGTGSSAVQIVGAVVDTVAELDLFQRTPQWILPVDNPPISEEDRARYRENTSMLKALRNALNTNFVQNFADVVVDADSPQLKVLQKMCRANLEDNVKDPLLREKLRPDYRVGCKRLVVSPNFYTAIQRPNAHLIAEHIDRVEAAGVRTKDGVLHRLDVLVLATGFRVDRFLRPIEVVGRGGVRLDDAWAERPVAYLSVSVPDFPNLFMLNGPNGPVGNFSLIDAAEAQIGYLIQLIELLRDGTRRQISASHQATARFEAERVQAAKQTVWMSGCRSWYLDDRGIPAAWPWRFSRFREVMQRPVLADYELI
ncbi:flavin-containing monooxygenase FMO [Phenylobacterium zucineum HLK1] [Mycobacterium shimoidei]|uniref:Flavin-containing monooxygenase FMO [Phenylobacterium zucineum HLK1] n=1 Tax=Mycobacterium shimoidei TaxID=29313 RepID=A0A375YTY0_MYCSH|nr:NAD(P)/FAD-dependent oxidoreductase [Mycobacterium shimoidei]SRX92272.1 flavin-containing monooxygenase FMO [Phenylobacterium zucineum HLK1] [Mycobacterium shimoidei]